ncbi:alcohol dehydrogenase catalytic domain-containing protein [bacterium]|jgi:alcohol dehydrogenase|nr:alcohol dehydrogenase catalytic domain-containing protein [Mariniblastus sp.]MDB2318314.1 alcohol dehydrogenase catalytic domain-containing protein [bacterium]
MKAACFESVGRVDCLQKPDPVISGPRDAIVKVSMAGLCGSDLHPFFGREAGLDRGTVMGHEMVGEIVELGSNFGNGMQIGDRVFAPFSSHCGSCFYCEIGLTSRCTEGDLFGWVQAGAGLEGCQSEYVRVPIADSTLMRVPDGLSDESALLLGDNFSTGYFCAEMAEVKPGGTYLVIGCGTVGLLAILSAIGMGAKQVFAMDPVLERRVMAESLGAIPLDANVVGRETVLSATSGRGADAVMELVGLPEAQKMAFDCLRPGGIMSVIGCHCTPNFSFSPVQAYDKNITYRSGRCPAGHYMRLLVDRVVRGDFDLSPFISHQFGIEEAEKAYQVFSTRAEGCLKAVFCFD